MSLKSGCLLLSTFFFFFFFSPVTNSLRPSHYQRNTASLFLKEWKINFSSFHNKCIIRKEKYMSLITALHWILAVELRSHVKSAVPREQIVTLLGSWPGSAEGNGHTSPEQESQAESLETTILHNPPSNNKYTLCFKENSLTSAGRGTWASLWQCQVCGKGRGCGSSRGVGGPILWPWWPRALSWAGGQRWHPHSWAMVWGSLAGAVPVGAVLLLAPVSPGQPMHRPGHVWGLRARKEGKMLKCPVHIWAASVPAHRSTFLKFRLTEMTAFMKAMLCPQGHKFSFMCWWAELFLGVSK